MTEHPKVALIIGMYEALIQGSDIPTLTRILSEDVGWHLPGAAPLSDDHRGRESVFAAMAQFDGSVQLELHDVLANDEHAVALLRATGSRKGKQYNALEIDIFHIREGKVTEFWSFSEDQRKTDEFWS